MIVIQHYLNIASFSTFFSCSYGPHLSKCLVWDFFERTMNRRFPPHPSISLVPPFIPPSFFFLHQLVAFSSFLHNQCLVA